MARRYTILDVFASERGCGNPLAVVVDGAGLDEAAMAGIARDFGLSETVFVFEPRDPINLARLRIFTPAHELPFAGHPTIGTAILLAEMQAADLLAASEIDVVLEEAIGRVTCTVRHRRGEAAHARFEAPRLAERTAEPRSAGEIAARLGVDEALIGFASHRPCGFSAGVPFTFVPLASIEALGAARLRPSEERDAFYLYTPADAGPPRAFRARMLATGLGVAEDPGTGSAAAAFAGVLLANERLADGDHDCLLHQGVEMGRPSRIGVAFTVGGGRLLSTAVGGHAVVAAHGTLDP